jgi:CheY-specific phosphatase CheX
MFRLSQEEHRLVHGCGTSASAGSLRERFASTLPGCAADVLSTMFFAEAIPVKSAETILDEPILCSSVSFSGPVAGVLRISLSENAAAVLASDFSGADAPLEPCIVEQAIGELANMICGLTLSRIEPRSLFTLSHPESASAPILTDAPDCFLELPEGLLRLSFRLD